MINNKNFTNKELRAGYRIGSRSILLQFFLFLFFSERFVNSKNVTQEMKIIPLPSTDFATYLFSTPTALCHCYWCLISLPLVCHTDCQLTFETCKFSSTFSVKIAISEALKLFFWNPPVTLF